MSAELGSRFGSGFDAGRGGCRKRVMDALAGIPSARPPCGELVITHGFLRTNNFNSVIEVIDKLGLDMVVLGETRGGIDGVNLGHGFSRGESLLAGLFVWWLLPGPISRILDAHGLVEMSHALLKDPGKAHEWLAEQASAVEAGARQGLAEGADGFIIADDLAGASGLLYPPHILESLYLPVMSRLVSRIKGLCHCLDRPCFGWEGTEHGPGDSLPVLFHSDGDTMPILPQIFQAGFDGIHGLQPSPETSWRTIRSLIEGKVFWGGMSWETRRGILTPEEAARNARELLAIWQGEARFIFGSVTGLYEGIPFFTVKAAYRALGA